MDIKNSLNSLHVVRSIFRAAVAACSREDYMSAWLTAFPFLSPEERDRLGREYAQAFRENGLLLGSVFTLPGQCRLLARAAVRAARGEEAWRPGASPQAVEILREEGVLAGLLADPLENRMRDLDLRIAEVERDLHLTLAGADPEESQFARGEADALRDLLEDLRALRARNAEDAARLRAYRADLN